MEQVSFNDKVMQMKFFNFYRVLLFVLIGVVSFLPMISVVLGYKGSGGGG